MKIRLLAFVAVLVLIVVGAEPLRHSTLFERQYPRSVQFSAPHLGIVDGILDRLWFSYDVPELLQPSIPVVHACPEYLTCQADPKQPSCGIYGTCVGWTCTTSNSGSCAYATPKHPCEGCEACK